MGIRKSRKETILVIDDSPDTLEVLHRSIEYMGFTVFSCEEAREAIEILKDNHIDLVITDYHMPFVGGIDVIRHVRENYKNTEVMMITGYASVEGAIEAIKAGAEEYLSKPFTDEELEQAISRSLEKLSIRAVKNKMPLKNISKQYGITGESKIMKKVFDSIMKAATNSLPVLVSGEPGTGKELAARAIHYESGRSDFPFIHVNCRVVPESILEGEVFGFMRTGSNNSERGSQSLEEARCGFLEMAGEGTVFFDEISETSNALQVKLLQALASGEITYVGDNAARKIKCRIMASTSKDLIYKASKGKFREDLFFRLNAVNISMPPLRDRKNDILLLCREIIAREYAHKSDPASKGGMPELSERAARAFLDYSWPGNIRELESVITAICAKSGNEIIDISDLPGHMRYDLGNDTRLDRTLEEVEIDYIREVLAKLDGNKTRAAELLGIDRKTLRDKIARHPADKT